MPPISDLPLTAAANGVRIALRVTPRAGADRLGGVARLGDGTRVLTLSLAAAPTDGQANEALLRLLAREWNVAPRDLAIIRGIKSRTKLVHVAGDPAALLRRLGAALAALPIR